MASPASHHANTKAHPLGSAGRKDISLSEPETVGSLEIMWDCAGKCNWP